MAFQCNKNERRELHEHFAQSHSRPHTCAQHTQPRLLGKRSHGPLEYARTRHKYVRICVYGTNTYPPLGDAPQAMIVAPTDKQNKSFGTPKVQFFVLILPQKHENKYYLFGWPYPRLQQEHRLFLCRSTGATVNFSAALLGENLLVCCCCPTA